MSIEKLDINEIRKHGFRKGLLIADGLGEVPVLTTDNAVDQAELETLYSGFHVYELVNDAYDTSCYTVATLNAEDYIGDMKERFSHVGTMLTADIIRADAPDGSIDLTCEGDADFRLTDEFLTIDTYIEITSEMGVPLLDKALDYLKEEVTPLYQDIIAKNPVRGLLYAITDMLGCEADEIGTDWETYASWNAVLTRPSRKDSPVRINESDNEYADILESLKPELVEA